MKKEPAHKDDSPSVPLARTVSTLILLAVAWAPFLVLSSEALFNRRDLWLLVIAPASFLVMWAFQRNFVPSVREYSSQRTSFGILLSFVILVSSIQYLWIGFLTSLANFSYGRWGFPPIDWFRLIKILFFCFLTRYFAEEIFLRGFVLRSFLRRFSLWKALLLMVIVQNAVFFAYWLTEHAAEKNLGVLRALLLENLIGLEAAAVFLISGSLLASTCAHALIDFQRTAVLADAESSFESLFFYSSSSTGFYWLIILNHLIVLALLGFWVSRIGKRFIEAKDA